MENTLIPEFYGQRELLRQMIDRKIDNMKFDLRDAGIDETRVQMEAIRELDIIAECKLCGYYFWLAQVIERIKVSNPFDIVTLGTGNGTVLANLFGFTGKAGMLDRLKKAAYHDGYYSQIYYGPIDARLDFTPFNLRLSSEAYGKLVKALSEVIMLADNHMDFEGIDLSDFETQRNLKLYISESTELDELTELYHHSSYDVDRLLKSNDKCVLDLICKRSDPEYSLHFCKNIKDGVINYLKPQNRDDFSYAAGLNIILEGFAYIVDKEEFARDVIENRMSYSFQEESWMEEGKVFCEDYLKDYIDGCSGEKFMAIRRECLKNQVFPKAHIDKFVELEWLYACFKLEADLNYMFEV